MEHLDKVIEDLSDGAAWIVLNNAETEFKKQVHNFHLCCMCSSEIHEIIL